jgi:sugar O-acyltransferase (sialic acid O-acetyltransferase NeuD family)
MRKLLVIGGGGYGRSVAGAVVEAAQFDLAGFADDRWPDLPHIWERPVLGRLADLVALRELADAAVVAIGDNVRRREVFALAAAAGFDLVSVVHPSAIVSPRAVLGKGVTVMAGAIVGCEARIDDGALVNSGSVVDHHCQVGRFAQLGVGACMGGGSVLGPGAWLQEGRALGPGCHVKDGATVHRTGIETA